MGISPVPSRRALMAALAALGLPVAAAFAVSGFAPSTVAPQAIAAPHHTTSADSDDDEDGPADKDDKDNEGPADKEDQDGPADKEDQDDLPFCDDLARDERQEAKENGDCKNRPAPKVRPTVPTSVPTPTVVISTVAPTTKPRLLTSPGATH